MAIRVMIVEDQAGFRRLLATLLARQADLEVVAEAGSLGEARAAAAGTAVDAILLDLNLPDGKGWDLIAELRAANPGVGVLVLSASFDAANLNNAASAGIDAILDKFASPQEMIDAVRDVSAPRSSGAPPSDPELA